MVIQRKNVGGLVANLPAFRPQKDTSLDSSGIGSMTPDPASRDLRASYDALRLLNAMVYIPSRL